MRAWVWATLLLTASACDSTGLATGKCITNKDCATGEQCISGDCRPLTSVGGCTTNDDCGQDEFCNAQSICEQVQVFDCTVDDDCPAHQACNVVQGICIDGLRTCTSQAQCMSAGLYCDFGSQTCRECTLTEHCGANEVCVSGTCRPEDDLGCADDTGCEAPFTVCEAGDCVAGCASTGSPITCGGGTACDSTTGRCGPGTTSCTQDTECGPPTTICENQQCTPSCTQTGGLQCTGGNVCDPSSGRCTNPGGCTLDGDCAPPASVCEAGQCVAGCSQFGGLQCGTGEVCDTNTGRCELLPTGCTLDSDCGPPSSVCEGGQCVGGCGAAGGLQCTGNTVCNATSGRCDPGTPVCTTDAECGAPANICNFQTGQCSPGCAQAGCTTPDVCNTQTGRCGPQQPMNVPLNGACTQHSECDSQVCFDLGSSIGMRCIEACSASSDCDTGFTCYSFNGAPMCLSGQNFGGAPFSTPTGQSCANGGQCQSNFCNNGTTCVERCSTSADCGGTTCGWGEISADNYISACLGPVGSAPQGASCSDDNECASGVCRGGSCGDLCSTSAQCPSGTICTLTDYSICPLEIIPGLCVGSYIPNVIRACLGAAHGTGAVGTPCTDWPTCRSGLCYLAGVNRCTDTCGTDADCPTGWRCRSEEWNQLPDGTPVYNNVCLPE